LLTGCGFGRAGNTLMLMKTILPMMGTLNVLSFVAAGILLAIGSPRIRNKRQLKLLSATITFALAGAACTGRAQEPSPKGYMRLDAGVVRQEDLTIRDSGGARVSYDTGFRFDVIGGGHFNESWSAEVE